MESPCALRGERAGRRVSSFALGFQSFVSDEYIYSLAVQNQKQAQKVIHDIKCKLKKLTFLE